MIGVNNNNIDLTQDISVYSSLQNDHLEIHRILIVDDEADIRSALTRILQLEGYEATEAQSGQEALNHLQNQRYDLMILDMRMPVMTGLDVLEVVQAKYPDILVIILTGQATLESAITATKTDIVVNYLLKPASTGEVLRAVEDALRKKSERVRQQRLVKAAAQVLTMQVTNTPSSSTVLPEKPTKLNLPADERILHVPPITLDRRKRFITIMNENPARVVELTKGEVAVLIALMCNPNKTLSCHELVSMGLGYDVDEAEAESVIRPYIFRLRRKLEPTSKKPGLIHTVRRRGYRFNAVEA